jgi:hypothetical protein
LLFAHEIKKNIFLRREKEILICPCILNPRNKVLKGAYIEFPVDLVGRRMCLHMALEVDVVPLFQISALKRQ